MDNEKVSEIVKLCESLKGSLKNLENTIDALRNLTVELNDPDIARVYSDILSYFLYLSEEKAIPFHSVRSEICKGYTV